MMKIAIVSFVLGLILSSCLILQIEPTDDPMFPNGKSKLQVYGSNWDEDWDDWEYGDYGFVYEFFKY
jgi:hypothetical protein